MNTFTKVVVGFGKGILFVFHLIFISIIWGAIGYFMSEASRRERRVSRYSALLLFSTLAFLAQPALAAEDLQRIAGGNRFATSVAISKALYPTDQSAMTAVIASGRNFPDALSGVSLANVAGGPLLLSETNDLPTDIATELQRVLPASSTVYVLGGESAVSASVEGELSALGYTVQRVASGNRYGTSIGIAAETDRARGSSKSHAYLVSGTSFADALSISPKAALNDEVLLLNPRDTVSVEVHAYLDATPDVTSVTVVGGTAVISDAVVAALANRGITVDRIAGSDRYQTGQRIGDLYAHALTGVGIASGENYPDALSAGPLLAAQGHPLLLVKRDNIGCIASGNFLYDYRTSIGGGFVFGGIAAISTATEVYAEKLTIGSRKPGDCDTHDIDLGNDGIDKNCTELGTQGQAQNYFEQDGGSKSRNIDDLDNDHDGLACEWNEE